MLESQKPLHPYEQSMLLVAMLFDNKNIKEVLSLLPQKQSDRMHSAKEKFYKLSRNERMTEIVFELRRMLLIDEHRIDWIHPSWIDAALAKEPPYLRPVIEKAIRQGSQKKSENQTRAFVPLPLVFNMFIDQLINTRQKTAIYDPVLMRLQSLKDEVQENAFISVGKKSLVSFAKKMQGERFWRFLGTRGLEELPGANAQEPNPFQHVAVKRHYFKELWQFSPSPNMHVELFAGLVTTALYLLPFKHHWQRTITLGFKRHLGLVVERIIRDQSALTVDKNAQHDLAGVMIASLDLVAN